MVFPQGINNVNAELKSNVLETSSVSIVRVDVVNAHTSVIYTYIAVALYARTPFLKTSHNSRQVSPQE
jgi:hypothetical protein